MATTGSKLDFVSQKQRYTTLLLQSKVLEQYKPQAKSAVTKVLASKNRYADVSSRVRVPWPLIAAIHLKEASGRFSCNLHNGQPLNMVTTIVPKGRGPFSSWEESAVDALLMQKKLTKSLVISNGVWSMEQCLWFAEAYNGWGYFLHHSINSPYVWCGTDAYSKGGYPRDGHYDPNFVIKNIGVATLLLSMPALDLSVPTDVIAHNESVKFVADEMIDSSQEETV